MKWPSLNHGKKALENAQADVSLQLKIFRSHLQHSHLFYSTYKQPQLILKEKTNAVLFSEFWLHENIELHCPHLNG